MATKHPPAKVMYRGYNFKINPPVVKNKLGEVDYLIINRVEASKMIRQFVKLRWDKAFKVWVRSESYSGGSSIRVYCSDDMGNPIPDVDFKELKDFSDSLRSGDFNGMDDSYNYREIEKNENGTLLNMYTSYIFCDNSAPWGTKEKSLYDIEQLKNI